MLSDELNNEPNFVLDFRKIASIEEQQAQHEKHWADSFQNG